MKYDRLIIYFYRLAKGPYIRGILHLFDIYTVFSLWHFFKYEVFECIDLLVFFVMFQNM